MHLSSTRLFISTLQLPHFLDPLSYISNSYLFYIHFLSISPRIFSKYQLVVTFGDLYSIDFPKSPFTCSSYTSQLYISYLPKSSAKNADGSVLLVLVIIISDPKAAYLVIMCMNVDSELLATQCF